jgi:DNA-binding transcriptional MocR family regulator
VRDLASGNPDPALMPPLGPVLTRIDPAHTFYGGPAVLPQLAGIARAGFAADGITGDIAVAGGALDGIERVLQAELRPGDRVGVEDPSWPRIGDLVNAIGLRPEPIAVDQAGPVPDRLAAALQAGARAIIATPRGQNPTGAAIDMQRAADIQHVLAAHPQVLVIEDDYIADIASAPYNAVHGSTDRWAVIRSVSKVFGPDLRLATLAADPLTASRVAGRQLLGAGWVSHLLQQIVMTLRSDATTSRLIARAEREYATRRAALVTALAERGIAAHGQSGLGVWIPAEEETAIVQALASRGWAVSPGERFRYQSAPGIRVTTATLPPDDARKLAHDIATAVSGQATTYAG